MHVYDTVHRNISLKAITSIYFKRVYNSLYMSVSYNLYDFGFGGTHASILGLVVLYGMYAPSVPERFSV